jgi:hypothetical protein
MTCTMDGISDLISVFVHFKLNSYFHFYIFPYFFIHLLYATWGEVYELELRRNGMKKYI